MNFKVSVIYNGTKKTDLTKTGYKGIGFKSVFRQSDKVTIFTNNEYFRFDSSYPFEWNWEDSKIEWEMKNDRQFQFPLQIIPIYTEHEEIYNPINQYLENIEANVATIIQIKLKKRLAKLFKVCHKIEYVFISQKYLRLILK